MSHFAELMDRNRISNSRRRKVANAAMLALTGLLTALALVHSSGSLVMCPQGRNKPQPGFLHPLPRPIGISGGGVLSAIEGTLVVTTWRPYLPSRPVSWRLFMLPGTRTPLWEVALRFSTDVLSGIPSIVVGLFAYAVIVVPMGHYSGLAGGAALAVIMLPTIIRTTEEMLKLVPATLREASLGLGAPEWKTSLSVLSRLPQAVS